MCMAKNKKMCSYCGSQLQADAKFCRHCGRPCEEVQEQEAKEEEEVRYCAYCGRKTGSCIQYCVYCGTKLPENALYCPKCGERIKTCQE